MMTSSADASITLGDDVALQIERIIEARQDVGAIIEATGHALELFMRGLPSADFVELLQSIREDLAAHRFDPGSTRLRELYDIAKVIGRYRHFGYREKIHEHLKEIARYIKVITNDGVTLDTDEIALGQVEGWSNWARRDLLRILVPESDGTSLGPYRLLELIATGGMCDVYVAYDERLDRKVAIKILRQDRPEMDSVVRQWLLREAQIIARITHPNIIRIYDFGDIEGRIFIVEEYVAGPDLRRWLSDGPGRHWRAVLEKFIAAGRGLAALHKAGFIQRDFKPDNVMIDDGGRVLLLDFGLGWPQNATSDRVQPTPETKAVYESEPFGQITREGSLVGTPAYMSPEQMRAEELDPRSDQFSFCVALYEALYGHRPFRWRDFSSLRESLLKGEVQPPPMRSNVPRQIWRVLLRGLATDRSARFPTMHDLLMALERAATRTHQRKYQWAAAAGFLTAGASLASGPMFVQTSSSYSLVWQVLALLAAALGGFSLGKALQTRSDRTAPKSGTPKPKEQDAPTA